MFNACYNNYNSYRGMKRSYRLDNVYCNSNNNNSIYILNILLMLFIEGFNNYRVNIILFIFLYFDIILFAFINYLINSY